AFELLELEELLLSRGSQSSSELPPHAESSRVRARAPPHNTEDLVLVLVLVDRDAMAPRRVSTMMGKPRNLRGSVSRRSSPTRRFADTRARWSTAPAHRGR